MPCRHTGAFSGKEGGIQVLAGLATSNQTVRSLLRNPLGSKAVWKKITKIEFGKFALVEECTQLLLIQHIQKSQKFK
jgi:hypothetical protein